MRGVSSSEDVGSPAPRVRFCTEILRNFLYQFLKFKFNLANPTCSHFVSHNFSSFIFFTLYHIFNPLPCFDIICCIVCLSHLIIYSRYVYSVSREGVICDLLSRWFAESPLVKCAGFYAKKVVLVV